MQDNGVIEAMRSWDPAGVPCKVSGSAGVSMRPQRMSTQRDLRGGEMDAAKDEDGDSSHAGYVAVILVRVKALPVFFNHMKRLTNMAFDDAMMTTGAVV